MFFQIQDRNEGATSFKNNFIQQPSKITMEPSQLYFLCNTNGTNNSTKLKNDDKVE